MPYKSKLKELAEKRGVTVANLLAETSKFGDLTLLETTKTLGVPDHAIKWWLKSQGLTWKLLLKGGQGKDKPKNSDIGKYKPDKFIPLYPNKPDLIEIIRH